MQVGNSSEDRDCHARKHQGNRSLQGAQKIRAEISQAVNHPQGGTYQPLKMTKKLYEIHPRAADPLQSAIISNPLASMRPRCSAAGLLNSVPVPSTGHLNQYNRSKVAHNQVRKLENKS